MSRSSSEWCKERGWGAGKAIHVSKTSEVLQGPEESPSQFCERLCEAFRLYPPFDPEAPATQRMINAAFVGQAQGDIWRKRNRNL